MKRRELLLRGGIGRLRRHRLLRGRGHGRRRLLLWLLLSGHGRRRLLLCVQLMMAPLWSSGPLWRAARVVGVWCSGVGSVRVVRRRAVRESLRVVRLLRLLHVLLHVLLLCHVLLLLGVR